MGITARDRNSNSDKTTEITQDDISKLIPDIKPEEIKEVMPVEEDSKPLTPAEEWVKLRWNMSVADLNKDPSEILARMEEYQKRMNGLVCIRSVEQGAENQQYLFSTILRALGLQGDDLFKSVDIILFFMNYYRKDTFRDDMAFRFIQAIRRPHNDVVSSTNFLEIFLRICDPRSRIQYAKSDDAKAAISTIQQSYKQATAGLVSYLSQYKQS